MLDEALLKQDEQAVYTLRNLFRRYGYLPYKMSKFEEYDLYVRNKDFLVSDRIITFIASFCIPCSFVISNPPGRQ